MLIIIACWQNVSCWPLARSPSHLRQDAGRTVTIRHAGSHSFRLTCRSLTALVRGALCFKLWHCVQGAGTRPDSAAHSQSQRKSTGQGRLQCAVQCSAVPECCRNSPQRTGFASVHVHTLHCTLLPIVPTYVPSCCIAYQDIVCANTLKYQVIHGRSCSPFLSRSLMYNHPSGHAIAQED
jgi:hypothetical protein